MTDWQWRTLLALGALEERDRTANEFAVMMKARPIVVPAGFEATEYFPDSVADGPAEYRARDYPFGYELQTANGRKVSRWSRQDRGGRAIWVQLA